MLSLLDSEDDINKLNDYFSYEHFYVIYCICEGTLVALADGTSVPIERVSVQDSVLSYAVATASQTEGLVPRQVTHVSDMGVKECVELLFSDSRTLTCTPDHRIRTGDGRWVEAGKLVIDVDEVAVGCEYPNSTLGAHPTAGFQAMDAVTYGVHEDAARVLPLFRVRLVARRPVGAKHVYDLTVPSEQGDHTASFTANGVVVHNCKFWELDSDHDGLIDSNDLSTYDDYSLTSKMIERVMGGYGRKLLSSVVGKMNYLDFIVFLVSEVDKSNRVSIAYW